MIPYLAILKDSFREAFASRVLWILLIMITVFLVAMAMIHVDDEVNWPLQREDIRHPQLLASSIRAEATSETPTVGKRIWTLLDSDSRELWGGPLDDAPRDDDPSESDPSQLAEALNVLLERPDFYEEAAWERYRLSSEIRPLIRAGVETLDENELLHLNRRLLEIAFPGAIAPSTGEAYYIGYLAWRFPNPIATDRQELETITDRIISSLISIFVGAIGVFIAVMVTASMIPNTFDAGAIDLLLSKPISRVPLFLTKFVGGCAFILLNGAYFLVGLWLIVGWRIGIWESGLLLCIPVFLFLFAIYYAVSALAGVIWRNAIVCVVMAILFWLVCFLIGQTHDSIKVLLIMPAQLDRIVSVDGDLVAVRKDGSVVAWNSVDRTWEQTFEDPEQRDVPAFVVSSLVIGPVYDSARKRLVAVPVRMFPSRQPLDFLVVGKRQQQSQWERLRGNSVPSNIKKLFVTPEGHIVAVSSHGIYRLEGELDATSRLLGDPQSDGGQLIEETAKRESDDEPYTSIGIDPWLSLSSKFAVAMDPKTADLAFYDAFYDRALLTILRRDGDGRYTKRHELEIEGDDQGLLAFAGGHVMIALAGGEILDVDANDLQVSNRWSPFGEVAPGDIVAAPGGRWFAIVYHNEKVYLHDVRRIKGNAKRSHQNNVTAAAFTDDNTLLLADGRARVWEHRLDEDSRVLKYAPKETRFQLVYHYVINPVYVLFPKPGALNNLVAYLLLEQDSIATNLNDDGLESARMKIDIWTPIWSNLAFVVVVLALGSLYVWRTDF